MVLPIYAELPLDLTQLSWTLTSNQAPEQALTIKKFPILPDKLLPNQQKEGPQHYILSTIVSFSGAPDQLPELGLQFSGMGEYWQVFWNGQLLQKSPAADENQPIYRYIRNVIIAIPHNRIQKDNQLRVELRGNSPPLPLLTRNFLLGFTFRTGYHIDSLSQLYRQNRQYGRLTLNSIYAFFGFYHLFFYFRWRKKKYNLFFGLFSLMISIYFVSFSNYAFEVFLDSRYNVFLCYGSQPLSISLFLIFLQSYFYPRDKSPRIMKALHLVNVSTFSLLILLPIAYYQGILIAWYYLAIPQILYIFYFVYRVLKAGKKDSIALGSSIGIILLFVFWDILDTIILQTGIRLVQYSYSLFIFSLVFILANRFIEIHIDLEKLNVELTRQKNSFFRFVPVEFLQVLGKTDAGEINLGDSIQKNMSVLFSDIRSFTNLAEKQDSSNVFNLLNSYLRRMEKIIEFNYGFVDKYLGDGILALFSETEKSTANSAERAINTSIQMLKRLERINQNRKIYGHEPLKIGIGIHTGNLILGTVGSPRRIDTTVIGDTVNLASRLEGLTSNYRIPLLISESTYEMLPDSHPFCIREIDTVQVKGRDLSTRVFEVFDQDAPQERQIKLQNKDRLQEAIDLYKQRKFAFAMDVFQALSTQLPSDPIPAIYIQRCMQNLRTEPTADWSYVTRLEFK